MLRIESIIFAAFTAVAMEDALIKSGYVIMMMIVEMDLMKLLARIKLATQNSFPALVVIASIGNGTVMVKLIVKMDQTKQV